MLFVIYFGFIWTFFFVFCFSTYFTKSESSLIVSLFAAVSSELKRVSQNMDIEFFLEPLAWVHRNITPSIDWAEFISKLLWTSERLICISLPWPSALPPTSQIMPDKSFLQAQCEEPIMTSDWGLPLLLALLMLALLYTFLYLPATAQRALLEQALRSNNTTVARSTADQEDWRTDG